MVKLAYVFPGQGSQSVGMLADLASDHSLIETTFDEASTALGYDLWHLVQEDPDEKLNQTEYTQPALLAASIAIWRVAMVNGAAKPEIVAGHSLGEYSALVAAEVIQFSDAIKLVQQRGQFMQTAVPLGEGGMAAVLGLEDDIVRELCAKVSVGAELVQAANYNAPGQVVIAGSNAALERAIEALKNAGAKRAMALAVSAPFHSELMKPAADKMAEALEGVSFSEPQIQVLQNVDADYHSNANEIRSNLVAQMYSAVLWTDTIQRLAADTVSNVVECGPGKVLSGLNKRIDKSIQSFNINSVESLAFTLESLG
ncbi:MAG: [acyl-carrier-protein] S-malonyltransferase [Patiriisocius sp.]|jgi:[acyl-carrier-protein] S-malonyltransferase